MDFTNRHHWKHPRTFRDAFGTEFEPLRKDLSFHHHYEHPKDFEPIRLWAFGVLAIVIVVLLWITFIWSVV
jgi:hypothetical protein